MKYYSVSYSYINVEESLSFGTTVINSIHKGVNPVNIFFSPFVHQFSVGSSDAKHSFFCVLQLFSLASCRIGVYSLVQFLLSCRWPKMSWNSFAAPILIFLCGFFVTCIEEIKHVCNFVA